MRGPLHAECGRTNFQPALPRRIHPAATVAAEVDRWLTAHRQFDYAVDLLTVAGAAEILPPSCLLSIASEVTSGDVMMVADLAPPQTREVGLSTIGAGPVHAVANLVIDPLHSVAAMELVPGGVLVSMDHGTFGDPHASRGHGIRFSGKHLCQRSTTAFAHDYDDLAVHWPVLGEPPIDPVHGHVLRSYMTTEVGTIDLRSPPFTTDGKRKNAGRHGLAQLMRQNERGLVLDIKVTGEGEHALALYLVAENRDGHEVVLKRQLVVGEQGAGGD
jgi:hypothetical protein